MMMTFRSIMNAIKGYNRDQEQQFQADWERARFIAAWATMKKMKDITFPWETEGEQSSLDRLKAIRAREHPYT